MTLRDFYVLMDYPAILDSEIPFMVVLPMGLRPIMAACEVIPVSEGITEGYGGYGGYGRRSRGYGGGYGSYRGY